MRISRRKSFELFLAFRHLRFARRRAAQTFTALAGFVGIACGVAVLIFAQALARGFRDELQDKILRGTAHINVQRADGAPFDEGEARALKLRLQTVAGVTEVSATSYAGALVQGQAGASYAVVRGVDRDAPQRLAEIRRTIIAGAVEPLFDSRQGSNATQGNNSTQESRSNQEKSSAQESRSGHESGAPSLDDETMALHDEVTPILVGAELAARVGLERVGDEGELVTVDDLNGSLAISPTSNAPVNSRLLAPKVRRVRVVGVFRTGLSDYDATWIYVAQANIGAPSVLSINTTNFDDAPRIADKIRALLGDKFTVTDWREANRSLFTALTLERRVVSLIIALIMFIAALNITTTLMLGVVERRTEIAILRVLGARARNIRRIFLFEGLLIGASGTALGVALGIGACVAANKFKLVRLSAEVYSLSFVPLHARTLDVLFAAGLALIFAVLAIIYPLRAALRVKPLEILRQ